MSTVTPDSASTIDRDWICAEFTKGVDAERQMSREARERADSPPEPSLGVLYGQMADTDDRHALAIETIAIRYGYTPAHGKSGGISETIGRLKDKVTSIGSSAMERLGHDLAAKANAIQWYTAWAHAFEAIGDAPSAREIAAIQVEEVAHRDAMQEILNRMVERGASGRPLQG